ncbi:peroxisomal membrane anchor protein conserved region-domain-containing protein [Mortierella sp. GBAus27b]|nr:peroxisomal membrane anchor protein conserved region-domain-containing protein [Mortierella sp. GBAus27b]
MSGVREDILASAVKFLQDPKVQSSPLGKKVAFLESKGLTSQEIEEALARANGTTAGTAVATTAAATTAVPGQPMMVPYQGPGQIVMTAPPPLPRKYDWKDMFIAAVVAGGFSYGVWQIAKNVLGPKLQWPSKEDLDLDKKTLDEQFEAIEKSLTEVKDSTAVVVKNVDEQTVHVKDSLGSMAGVLDGMKNNENKREQKLAGLKSEIENIRAMIPQLMDQNKESQANTLNELQTEIKSLKSLLLNRRTSGGTPASAGTPGSTSSAPWSSIPSSFSAQNSPTMASPSTAGNDAAMSFLSTKASIPAWQLAASKSSVPVSTSTGNNSADSTVAGTGGSDTTTTSS